MPKPLAAAPARRIMDDGATLIAPDTVFLSHDTVVGKDVTIEPNVVIGPKASRSATASTIRGLLLTSRARRSGQGRVVGPFARLRPGARI